MTRFDEIEERRELTDGLAYEKYRERMAELGDEPGSDVCGCMRASEGAYEISDPKHPDHHDMFAASWDMRGGK